MSDIKDGGPAFPCEQGMNPDGKWNDTFDPGMSLRQYAAIHLCIPDSGLGWLDEMIKEARRDRIAEQALIGMNASPELMQIVTSKEVGDGSCSERLARSAYKQSEAMITEGKKYYV